MSHPRLLCLGEILIDCLRDPDVGWMLQPGGAPANVACGLATLGVPVGLISAIGDDAAGRSLLTVLESKGVDVSMVSQLEAVPTRHVYVERDGSGDRRFVGFGTGDRDDTAVISSADFADARIEAAQVKPAAIVRADWLVTGTLGLALPTTGRAIRQAVGMAKQSLTSVFIDVNWRSVFWAEFDGARPGLDLPETPRDRILRFLTQADWLKFSDEEARYLLDTDDPPELAARFPAAQGVIVTRGDRGCAYQVGALSGEVAGFAVEAIDTTGAGDCFVAAFLAQWCDRGEADFSGGGGGIAGG
ncbi:MAG: carbohydrate kinase [Coleofasciculaceae cyanobacterium RL_1_1]|nr:carbohydrate kinase [Coleofasciculaceae cyanobacterium RL_1_1]